MKIIGLIKRDSGVDLHRILMPLILMDGHDAYVTNAVEEKDFEERCDAIYYNREVSEDVLKAARKVNAKIVLDVDDYWHLDPHHIAYNEYLETKFADIQISHIQRADVVTTTHERLAEKISEFNKNVVIVPNAIPDHQYFPVNKTESERTRIFWQGSITHEKDIALLQGPVKRLDHRKVLMIIAGFTDHPVWHSIVSAYTNGLQLKGAILKGEPPHQYYKNYQYADICVCPLLGTTFNGFKSNLKILEAAHSGVPVIASAVNPYLNMPVLYTHSQKDWYKHLQLLINEPEARKEQGERLHRYCKEHFNYNLINEKRKECFK